jgi:hypothetical protein
MSTMITSKYGAPSYQRATSDASPIGAAAVTSGAKTTRLSPENPMLWLFGIGAVTMGFVAFSTHARVGKLKASLSV